MTTNQDDNDTGEHPVPRLSDSEALLRRVADIIAQRKTMPLSSSAMINRDEMLELLDEAIDRLPEELRAARWLLEEREEFLAKTRREADDILDAARAQAERMVQRTEVVRGGRAPRPPGRRLGRGRGAAAAPRGRGLLRPELAQLRDRARQGAAHGASGTRAPRAHGSARARRSRSGSRRRARSSVLRPGPVVTTLPGLVTPVADLLRHPGERRHIALELRATEIDVGDAAVPDGSVLEIDGGPRVAVRRDRGHAHGTSTVASRVPALPRAARTVSSSRAFVRCTRSRTRAPTDDEVFPISADSIDLGPAVHDALLLELPAGSPVPRCLRRACARSCGVDRNHARCSCRVRQHRPTLGCARRAPPASAGRGSTPALAGR